MRRVPSVNAAEVAGLGGAEFFACEADAVAVGVAVGREGVPFHPVAARGRGEGGGEVFFKRGLRREERLGGRRFGEDGTAAGGDPGGGVECVGERLPFWPARNWW